MIRNAENTFMCVVDLQEKLLPAMGNTVETLKRIKILLGGAAAMQIPFLVTEQYPKGLGNTVPEVKSLFPEQTKIFEKNSFSCFGCQEFSEAATSLNRKAMILLGVESHVCVMQTAMDALERGMEVYLIEDCVDSRNASDKTTALAYLRQAGVQIMSSEMILFLLLHDSKNPAFKTVSKLVK